MGASRVSCCGPRCRGWPGSGSPGGDASPARGAWWSSSTTSATSTPSSWESPACRGAPSTWPMPATSAACRFARLLFAVGRVPGAAGQRRHPRAALRARAARWPGSSIVVFAEGRAGWGAPMGEFLEGAGHLGLTPGVTVVPAAIWGVQHFMQGLAPRRPRPGAGGVRASRPGPRGRPPPRARRRAHPPHAGGGGRAARADDARPPVIAHAAPPPVISAPPVSFGHAAVRLRASAERVEVQADGRITARLRPPPGPRRIVGAGARRASTPVRVRAIGAGGVALVGDGARARPPAQRPARRAHPRLRRPGPAARRGAAGGRHLRDRPASTCST